jgi:hypothetical protein
MAFSFNHMCLLGYFPVANQFNKISTYVSGLTQKGVLHEDFANDDGRNCLDRHVPNQGY